MFPHSCHYAGDINRPQADWGYGVNDANGKCLDVSTAFLSFMTQRILLAFTLTTETLVLLNPDLGFVGVDSNSGLSDRHFLEKFTI